jgi:ketosteroid isomerase-like protein
MLPGAPARIGVEAIREAMHSSFNDLDQEFDLVSIDESLVHGDLGLTRCTYSLRATPKAGGDSFDIMKNGKALTLYSRQPDGSWKLVFDCFNSNLD